MTVEQIILTLLVPTIVALAGAIVQLWRNQGKVTGEVIDRLKKEVAELQGQVTALQKQEMVLQKQIADLQAEKAAMQTQFLLLHTSHESSPLPMWIKDQSGKVLAANDAYEKNYLRPLGKKLEDWIGHFDRDVFAEDVVSEWEINDQWVFQNEQVWDGTELIDLGDGKRTRHRIIKHPRYARGISRPFGIAGIAIPEDLS